MVRGFVAGLAVTSPNRVWCWPETLDLRMIDFQKDIRRTTHRRKFFGDCI
jgi:hypothetical protein